MYELGINFSTASHEGDIMHALNFNQAPRNNWSSISITIALHIIVFGLALQTGRIIIEPSSKPVTVTLEDTKPIDPPTTEEIKQPKIILPEQTDWVT